MTLFEDEDFRIVARKDHVVEIEKATGLTRLCGPIEAERYWDRFTRHGQQPQPKQKDKRP